VSVDKGSQVLPASIEEELRLAGFALKALHKPRRKEPLLRVLIRTAKATDLEIAATVASLFGSACQDFVADILLERDEGRRKLANWLATDDRFSFITADTQEITEATFTLVLGAGTALGVHSLEAMVESLRQTEAMVLRALVDGQPGAIELWKTGTLRSLAEAGDPEKAARNAGGERWVSGSALGLHDFRRPKPKLHLRKGAAATLDLTIVVRDLADSATRLDYEQRIRELESRLKRSEVERRRLEQGLTPNRGLARAGAIASKGPKYILGRLKARAGKRSGS
jgi:hypothetical protein